VRDTIVLGRYIVGVGTLRFVIEFIRVNGRVALGLSVAHLVSLVAIVVGIGLLCRVSARAAGCPIQAGTVLDATPLSRRSPSS
jgi:prolipoprotein diacylglyceryltransferase